MLVQRDGVCRLFVRPADCESLEVKRGFVMLAGYVYETLRSNGVRQLAIIHAASINRLGDSLEREGLLGEPFSLVRIMHFADHGGIARKN
jgi:hypothetical protein